MSNKNKATTTAPSKSVIVDAVPSKAGPGRICQIGKVPSLPSPLSLRHAALSAVSACNARGDNSAKAINAEIRRQAAEWYTDYAVQTKGCNAGKVENPQQALNGTTVKAGPGLTCKPIAYDENGQPMGELSGRYKLTASGKAVLEVLNQVATALINGMQGGSK